MSEQEIVLRIKVNPRVKRSLVEAISDVLNDLADLNGEQVLMAESWEWENV